MRFSGLLFSVFCLLALPIAHAQQPKIEFSADTIESDMQGNERTGKLYIGKDRVRTDFDMAGQTLIQIVDLKAQEALIINTREKSYLRRSAGPGDTMPAPQGGAASPCAGMQNITCKQTGTEDVNGRPARKWEFENEAEGQTGTMTIWLDEQRGMPVRQIMPDGSGMEMRMLGPDKIAGRQVEKWELTTIGPDGKSSTSYQWYDPELKINIREEADSGLFRELRNITIGKQPDEIFKVPAGYEEITMPMEPDEQSDQ